MLDLQIAPCKAPLWANSGHLQTLIAYGLPSPKISTPFKKYTVPLPCGDLLVGRYYPGTSQSLIVIFHGLIGSADSSYMGRMALVAQKQNHSVLLMNHRDCGEGYGLARGIYHSGRGDDISDVIKKCRQDFPQKQIIALGFSLSANALLSLLCGLRGDTLPDAAIAVNGPSDLKASAESLKMGWNRIYDLWFVKGCRDEIIKKQKMNQLPTNIKINPWAHLTEVDEVYTAPLAGFKNADDYYASCSTAPHLQKIKIPTFILMSKDDPFIPWQPYLNAQNNSHVHLHLENSGGHMGYLSQTQTPWRYKRWMDEVIEQVLQKLTQ